MTQEEVEALIARLQRVSIGLVNEPEDAVLEAIATLCAQAAEIARLRKALEPFARDGVSSHLGDIPDLLLLKENMRVQIVRQSPPHWYFDKPVLPEITIADLRRARARGGEHG